MFFIKKLSQKISQALLTKSNNFPIKSYITFTTIYILSQRQKVNLLNQKQTNKKTNLFQIPENIITRSKQHKIILVLDLDQTLVHTRSTKKPNHQNFIQLQFQGQKLYVQVRPNFFQFLQGVSQIFTIYVYTASRKNYADLILDIIDKQKRIQKRFYRQSCRKYGEGYVKDLKSIKKSIGQQRQMILVDDNSDSILYNLPNSIKIKKFEGDQKDQQFIHIFNKLIQLYKT